MQVTLQQLRQHGPCVNGYNKLVAHLRGVPYTPRKTYVRWKHDAPISLETILDSNGVQDAVWATQCLEGYDRELRHFAVACVSLLGPTDPRSLKALEVAEAFADGKATKKELDKACYEAWDAYDDATSARAAAYAAVSYAAARAAYDAAHYAAYVAAYAVAYAVSSAVSSAAYDAYSINPEAVTDLFRDMLRNEAAWSKHK